MSIEEKNEIIKRAQRSFLHITDPELAKAKDEIDRLTAEVERLKFTVDILVDWLEEDYVRCDIDEYITNKLIEKKIHKPKQR